MKYTDDEKVISILEFCVALQVNTNLTPENAKTLLDLINRQKAEIERLHKEVGYWEAETKEARADIDQAVAEAIKEFAERLKVKAGSIPQYHFNLLQVEDNIDTLVKEMTGVKK